MGSLFHTDGRLYQILVLIYDLFLLNLLWIICSIPIFTIGASTTALYYVMFKRLNKEEAKPIQNFFKSFKSNFKQSTIVFLIMVLIAGIIYITISNKDILTVPTFFIYLQYTVLIIGAIIAIYIFPLIGRFDTSLLNHLKNAFTLSIAHFITTILCSITLFSLFYIMINVWQPISLVIVPLYSLWSAYFLDRVLKRYMKEE